jgi:hypothetical protein
MIMTRQKNDPHNVGVICFTNYAFGEGALQAGAV